MKKIFITSFALLFALLIGGKNVSALSSIELRGPDVISGKTISNETDTFTVFGESSVKGARLTINIMKTKSLLMGATSGKRLFYIDLWEADEYPNANDHVKGYQMNINGRQLVKGFVDETPYDDGNIDSQGDNTVELYVTNYLPYMSGDNTNTNNSNIFTYQYVYS